MMNNKILYWDKKLKIYKKFFYNIYNIKKEQIIIIEKQLKLKKYWYVFKTKFSIKKSQENYNWELSRKKHLIVIKMITGDLWIYNKLRGRHTLENLT